MSVYDELRKLHDLLKDGILSEDEFREQKARLLKAGPSIAPELASGASRPGTVGGAERKPKIYTGAERKPKTHTAAERTPKTYRGWPIVTALLCCLPFGIVSLLKSNQVSRANAAKNFVLASKRSAETLFWIKLSAITGGTLAFLYGLFALVGYFASGVVDSPPSLETERQLLDGEWHLEGHLIGGRPGSAKPGQIRITIMNGNSDSTYRDDDQGHHVESIGRFVFDWTGGNRLVDRIHDSGTITYYGIYKFDKDHLIIAESKDSTRPQGFEPSKGAAIIWNFRKVPPPTCDNPKCENGFIPCSHCDGTGEEDGPITGGKSSGRIPCTVCAANVSAAFRGAVWRKGYVTCPSKFHVAANQGTTSVSSGQSSSSDR
jgi:hypothetical protein